LDARTEIEILQRSLKGVEAGNAHGRIKPSWLSNSTANIGKIADIIGARNKRWKSALDVIPAAHHECG
jgi:hypothetical protein